MSPAPASGPLVGLRVIESSLLGPGELGEVVVSVGQTRAVAVALPAGALAFGGIAWAGWIDSSEGVEPVKGLVWVAAGLAAATALVRTTGWRRRTPAG